MQNESAEPTILALVILDEVLRLGGHNRVLPHDVVVHEGLGPEQGEAAGTAKDAADRVLGGFLQPVADRVFELLVPDQWTCVAIRTMLV